mmetsp:Transcript_57759/g.135055  ORF Transcript_57759/g.135055 Transcript_57759/m.135055 type:complete len:282 (+) Transcript_57759:74-919(+)
MTQPGESAWLKNKWCSSKDDIPVDPLDLLDAMEQGFAKEVTTAYTTPLDSRSGERRLTVERAENRRDFQLLSEWGETLLLAKGNKDCTKFEICLAGETNEEGAYKPGAAFQLQTSSEGALGDWTLSSQHCESCASSPQPIQACRRAADKRVLAKFHQYQVDIGEGQAFCMDINIPEVTEGDRPPVWCACCSGCAATPGMKLTSRRPKWSARQNTLALDFHGRCKVSSTKNFMLEWPGSERRKEDVKLLFGKVNANTFNLDISQPFSLVQAFAAALSVSKWA